MTKALNSQQTRLLATGNVAREDYSQTDQGWALISTTTNAIHALYVPGKVNINLNPRKIIAKLRFLPARNASPTQNSSERTWRLLVVLSVLSMTEKARQFGAPTSGLSQLFYTVSLASFGLTL